MKQKTSAGARPGAPDTVVSGAFAAHRAANTGSFVVDFPVGAVFPLYGAARETRWDPSFQPAWIFPEAAVAGERNPERGWVFATDPGAREERVWYVERFDTAGHEAVYLVHWPGHMIYRIEITAAPAGEGAPDASRTRTNVRYEFVGLSEEGNGEVRARTADPRRFAEEMIQWGRMISDCLNRAEE
jgi:hypothetical protein